MIKRSILILSTILLTMIVAVAIGAQAPVPPVPQIDSPNVTPDRLLKAAAEPQNWLMYSGAYNSHRHSPLTQITTANAKDLSLKWVFQSRSLEKSEVTPLVVNGIMYTTQSINDVIALNAVTGKTLWTYSHKPDPAARNCCGNMTRGLAISGDLIFLAGYDTYLIALDAKTGKEAWKILGGDPKQGQTFTHAPLVIKDKVIAGVAGGERGARGFIAAWDVKTGKEAWRFNTVPGPGEPGHETWAGDSWKNGGAPIWVTGSYDPETNLTYWGTGNPGPDWDGRNRAGDNLYSCSVIALNADTGKLSWHYQFTPHDEFDWDSTQVPVLADMEWQGRPRKLMLFANRNGVFYVLDRTNGQFLKGTSFVKTNWVEGFDAKGRPNQVKFTSREGTLVFPGNQGGTNWYNPSYSPRTGLFYIPVWENSSTIYLLNETPPTFHEGQGFAGAFPRNQRNADQFSAIRAIDPKTGEKKWDYRMEAPSMDAGVLTTASDVLFSGGRDGQFFALDARDGKLLWQTNLGPSVFSGPMTYSVNGNQYVSVVAGNGLFTFGLR